MFRLLPYPALFAFVFTACGSDSLSLRQATHAASALNLRHGTSSLNPTPVPAQAAPLVIAHRGSAGTNAENTLAAMAEGYASGANLLELDLQLMSDDMPLLSHDSALEKWHCRNADTTPLKATVAVGKLTTATRANYDCGYQPDHTWHAEKPPTFKELLDWHQQNAADMTLLVHMKEGYDYPAFSEAIMNQINDYGLGNSALFMAGDDAFLQAAMKQNPYGTFVQLYSGSTSFCDEAAANGMAVAGPAYMWVTKDEVAKCHAAGIKVFAWTVNQPKDWASMIAMGVDGLVTDYPRALEAYLNNKDFTPPKHKSHGGNKSI